MVWGSLDGATIRSICLGQACKELHFFCSVAGAKEEKQGNKRCRPSKTNACLPLLGAEDSSGMYVYGDSGMNGRVTVPQWAGRPKQSSQVLGTCHVHEPVMASSHYPQSQKGQWLLRLISVYIYRWEKPSDVTGLVCGLLPAVSCLACVACVACCRPCSIRPCSIGPRRFSRDSTQPNYARLNGLQYLC